MLSERSRRRLSSNFKLYLSTKALWNISLGSGFAVAYISGKITYPVAQIVEVLAVVVATAAQSVSNHYPKGACFTIVLMGPPYIPIYVNIS